MPKAQKDKQKPKHDPLHVSIMQEEQPKVKKPKVKKEAPKKEDKTVSAKLSRKILEEASKQIQEDEEESGRAKPSASLEMEEEDVEEDVAEEEEVEIEEVDAEDAKLLDMFMSKPKTQTKVVNLSEMILEKIREKEKEAGSQTLTKSEEDIKERIHPKVVSAYKKIGEMLKKYRSGKIPKAFKVIPALSNWEEVVFLTEPDNWSAQAVYKATCLFAANLKDKLAQRYYNMILLPRIRDDIRTNNKLNHHLYQALRKACFKPAGFFKGIILPLAEAPDCSIKEAEIVSSVMKKTSLPILHASAALLKLANMEYKGTNAIFIKQLVEKRYALPTTVINAVVDHFHRFTTEQKTLPVMWHQTLLTFVQTYKQEFSPEQKKLIYAVCKKHTHHLITQEIRRELTTNAGGQKPETNEMQLE